MVRAVNSQAEKPAKAGESAAGDQAFVPREQMPQQTAQVHTGPRLQ